MLSTATSYISINIHDSDSLECSMSRHDGLEGFDGLDILVILDSGMCESQLSFL